MLGIVGYDASDSENESDSESVVNSVDSKSDVIVRKDLISSTASKQNEIVKKSIDSYIDAEDPEFPEESLLFESSATIGSLLASLPPPVKSGKRDSIHALLGELPAPSKSRKKQVSALASIPMHPDVSSDEEELPELKKHKFKSESKNSGSGLIGILPKPATTFDLKKTQLLLPESVKKNTAVVKPKLPANKSLSLQSSSKATAPSLVEDDISDDDDTDLPNHSEEGGSTSGSYFSFVNGSDQVSAPIIQPVEPEEPQQTDDMGYYDIGFDEYQYVDQDLPAVADIQAPDPELSRDIINPEALKLLKGRRNEEIQITDVNADEQLQDVDIQLTRGLTEEQDNIPIEMLMGKNKKKDPEGSKHRSKHQLQWLVQQAQAREVSLKNQWADNRMSKKATQSKYGF